MKRSTALQRNDVILPRPRDNVTVSGRRPSTAKTAFAPFSCPKCQQIY